MAVALDTLDEIDAEMDRHNRRVKIMTWMLIPMLAATFAALTYTWIADKHMFATYSACFGCWVTYETAFKLLQHDMNKVSVAMARLRERDLLANDVQLQRFKLIVKAAQELEDARDEKTRREHFRRNLGPHL